MIATASMTWPDAVFGSVAAIAAAWVLVKMLDW